jgi:hypothetical protein
MEIGMDTAVHAKSWNLEHGSVMLEHGSPGTVEHRVRMDHATSLVEAVGRGIVSACHRPIGKLAETL